MNALVIYIYLFLLGGCLGSFFGVLMDRIPKGESIITPGSYCVHCYTKVKIQHNIPMISYVVLKGRCKTCNTRIPFRYFLVEVVTALLLCVFYWLYGPSVLFIHVSMLMFFLVPISFIDFQDWIVPDVITYPGILTGLMLNYGLAILPFYQALLGGFIGAGSFWLILKGYKLIRKKEGMGFGDVKLMGMIGVFLGPLSLAYVIFFSAVVGTLFGMVKMIKEGSNVQTMVPFGSCLTIGTVLFLLLSSKGFFVGFAVS